MSKVLINTNFFDAHTRELYIAGEFTDLTEERIAEVKLVDPNFITVVKAESNTGSAPTTPVNEQTGTTEPETEPTKVLGNMTKKELIEVGKEYGLELNDSMTKNVMLEAIEGAMNPVTEPETEPTDTKPSTEELIDDLEGTVEDIVEE